ncbi:hypothetical protein ACVWWD_005707 [Mesorhizobium sp. URHB0026]
MAEKVGRLTRTDRRLDRLVPVGGGYVQCCFVQVLSFVLNELGVLGKLDRISVFRVDR